MSEVWKRVDEYPDYEVSTLGRVRSFRGRSKGILLKGAISNAGYILVRLKNNHSVKLRTIHRLVAEAFIPNPLNKSQVNHKNGMRRDNRVENLEWVTPSENTQHAYDTGLESRGEARYNAKLTREQVIEIRNKPKEVSCISLAKKYGVCKSLITRVRKNKTWKSI